MASACFGQEDAESFRPNLLVPSAQICFANTEEGADAEDLQIEKGKKVATLPTLGKEWSITFDLLLSKMPKDNEWMGILLVAASSEGDKKDWKKAGSRFPGIFYHGKKKEILVKHFIGEKEKNLNLKNKDSKLAVDEPLSFKISQEMEDGKLMYKVEIGGEEKLSEEQTGAFEGPVDVYADSPAHNPVPGVLQNFKLVLAGAAEE